MLELRTIRDMLFEYQIRTPNSTSILLVNAVHTRVNIEVSFNGYTKVLQLIKHQLNFINQEFECC